MKSDSLTSLLADGTARDPERSPPCPDEHEVAGYVDGGLDESARAQVERHLADCGHCLALVGLLSQEQHEEQAEPVPGVAAKPARVIETHRPQRRGWLAPQWAAAAALVLAVPLLMQLSRNLDRGAEGQGRPDPSATRIAGPTASEGLQVLSPRAGATVDSRGLMFRWTEVAGTPFYDVRIVTDAGDVVVEQRVTDTTWRPPETVEFEPQAEYFVHVDAFPSGDKAVSSDHVLFLIKE
jgi:hypothetical protein